MSGIRVAACFHGFLRTGASMWWISRELRRQGYAEVALPTFGYHLAPLDLHAERAAAVLTDLARRHPGAAIDVVTHSYGGILARAAISRDDAPPIRRVVMLSPPNQGARWAERVRSLLPIHRIGWDPLGQCLPGIPCARPQLPAEVGILTGGTGTAGYNPWLDADNDGTVTVEEARLEGAADFHVIRVHHSLMPLSRASLAQMTTFLRTGAFAR